MAPSRAKLLIGLKKIKEMQKNVWASFMVKLRMHTPSGVFFVCVFVILKVLMVSPLKTDGVV